MSKKKKNQNLLTVHVDVNGGTQRLRPVVVDSLTRQLGMKVGSSQALDGHLGSYLRAWTVNYFPDRFVAPEPHDGRLWFACNREKSS